MSHQPQTFLNINSNSVNIDTNYVTLATVLAKAGQRLWFTVTFISSNGRSILTDSLSISYRIRGTYVGEVSLGKGSIYTLGDEVSYNSCTLSLMTDDILFDDTFYLECASDTITVVTARVTGCVEFLTSSLMVG